MSISINDEIEIRRRLPCPWRITFDTNPDDCNLHCIMCEEHSFFSPKHPARRNENEKRRVMDFAIIDKIVRECVPHGLREVIPSTMGEPLLYRNFRDIIGLCYRYGIKMNLTTNGTFPGCGASEWAEIICPVSSDVKISWNGVTEEVQEGIMVGSPLNRRMDDLKAFLEVRDSISNSMQGNHCSVTLQLTFMEMNLTEIPDLVRFAMDLGIDRVKGHHLWVNFPEMEEQSLRRSPDSIQRWNDVVHVCNRIADRGLLPNGKKIRLANFQLLDPDAGKELFSSGECPFLGREAWINHEGRFDPCCAPNDLRSGLGYFGNVTDRGLLAVWNSDKYEELVENYLNHTLCHGCNMRVLPGGIT